MNILRWSFSAYSFYGRWVRNTASALSSLSTIHRVPGFLFSRPIGSSEPPTGQRCCPPPPSSRGETHPYGRGGGGSQFSRKDRHSGTLGIVLYNPCTPWHCPPPPFPPPTHLMVTFRLILFPFVCLSFLLRQVMPGSGRAEGSCYRQRALKLL
jgi:hypothetical protein